MTLAIDTDGRTTLAPIEAGAERARDAAAAPELITSSQPENSPFLIGLTGHSDLAPAQLPQLVADVVAFLHEIKQHLPDTGVQVLLDAGTEFRAAFARALPSLDVRVEALNVARDSMPAGDPMSVDTLLRRSSLLLVLWDGKPSNSPGDTAELVFRFVGVESRARLATGSRSAPQCTTWM